MTDPSRRLQFTRFRDLFAVFAVLAVLSYVLVRLLYGNLPVFPRLAGISAAVVGVAEALIGFNVRARLRRWSRPAGAADQQQTSMWGDLAPLPALVGARLLALAKATALAGAGLTGIWVGLLIHVAPRASSSDAASSDTVTAVIGAIAAVVMTAGALWLERCCVAPDDSGDHGHRLS